MTQGDGINIGDLTAGIGFTYSQADLQRTLDDMERQTKGKITVSLGLDDGRTLAGLKDIRAELEKLTGQSTKASREQAAAARSLEAQYRATGQAQVQASRTEAAQSAARTAALREQSAAYALQARMAAQARQEEGKGLQALANEQRASRNFWQARQISNEEVIEQQRRIYQQALQQAQAVDKTSDAYRRLTQVMAGAQRTIDSAQGINTPGGFGAGVTQGIVQALGNLGPFGQLLEQIISAGMNAAEVAAREGAQDVAQAAGAGLQSGLAGQAAQTRRAAVNLAREVQEGAEDRLDIRSPSRVMHRVGQYAGEGLADGLLSKRAEVAAAAKTLAATVEQNATPNPAALSGGGLGGAALPGLAVLPSAQEGLKGAAAQAALATAAIGGTALAVGVLGASMVNGANKAAEYQQGLAEISTLTDKMPGQLNELGVKILKLSVDTRKSFADLKAGYEEILGASVRGTENQAVALQFLERSATLAKVTRTETKVAADALTSILNAYSMDATSAAKVTDMLWASIAAGKVRLDQIAGSLGAVAGQANELGIPLEELLGAMALLTTRGIPASTALEYIRSALSNVQKPSKEAADTAADLGIQFSAAALKSMGLVKFLDQLGKGVGDNSKALSTLIGDVGGLQAVIGLLNGGLDDTGGILDKVTKSYGELDKAAAKLKGTAQDSVDEFRRAWERTQILFSGSLLSSFTDFLDKGINPLLVKLGDLKTAMNNAATPAELKATLQITSGDDLTTGILKLLIGGGVGLQEFGKSTLGNALQNSLNPLRGIYQAGSFLLNNPNGNAAPTNQADVTLKRIQPLKGEGPLLPGQMRVGELTISDLNQISLEGKAAAFFNAIFRQESGGRYDAFNTNYAQGGQGALGKYQVMPQNLLGMGWNIPQSQRGAWALANMNNLGVKGKGWDFEVLGRDITPQQFLDSPELQEAISQARMAANLQKRLVEAGGDLEKAVKEAAKDWYGRVTPAKGPTPDAYAESIWRRFQQEAAAGTPLPKAPNGSGTAAAFAPKTDQALLAEAKRILDRLEKATKEGNVTGKVQAEKTLKAFEESGPRAAAALEIVRSQVKSTSQEVSKFGQGFDKLKNQLDLAGSTFKLNDNAKAYAQSLDAISKAALNAANAEKARNGQTDKYRALLDLAGDAAGKAREIRERQNREQDQAAKDAEAATERAVAEQVRLAERVAAEGERRLAEAKQRAAAINEAIRQGNIEAARLELGRLEQMRENDLRGAGENAAKIAAVELRYSELTYQARKAIAEKEKKDRDADITNNPNLSTAARQQALNNSAQTYRNALAAASNTRAASLASVDEALTAQATRSAGAFVEAFSSGLEASLRASRAADEAAVKAHVDAVLAVSGDLVERLREQRAEEAQDVAAGTTNAALVLGLGTNLEQELRAAQQVLLDIQREGNEALAQGAIEGIEALTGAGDYDGALSLLESALDDVMTAAQAGEDAGSSINLLVDAINALTGARERAEAADTAAFLSEINTTAAQSAVTAAEELAGRDVDTALEMLEGTLTDLWDAAERGEDAAEAISTVTEAINRLTDARERSEAAVLDDILTAGNTQAGQDAVRLADDLAGGGQYAEAIEVLEATLTDLYIAAENGEDAAEAINTVTDAINRLTRASEDAATRDYTEAAERAAQAAIDRYRNPDDDRLEVMNTRLTELVEGFEAGALSAFEFGEQIQQLAPELERLAEAAEAQGKADLAKVYRDAAAGLKAMTPQVTETLDILKKVQEYASHVRDLAGAFGGLAEAAGVGDLAANLNGAANAAGRLADMAVDVGRLVMSGGADIGAWVSLTVKLASSIADALSGFQRARQEVQRLKDDFAKDNPLLNAGDYQKAFTRSRGFFADVFGGGPEVVNQIDEVGLRFAKTLQSAFADGIKNGLTQGLLENNFNVFRQTLREEVFGGVLTGLVDAFFEDELIKNIVAPAIKAWSDALKTPDPGDDAAALAGIDAAISQVDAAANKFYSDVAPKLQDIQQKWGVGQNGQSGPTGPTGNLFGNAPSVQLGIPRLEFTLPANVLAGFTGFATAVPVFAEASQRMLDAANLILSTRSGGGLQAVPARNLI